VREACKACKTAKGFISGGVLVDMVGMSDGADISTEPAPIGVRECSLVVKYESLVQVLPKGHDELKQK
jgi:nuclear inhibitor of protein phosphatase 1